MLATWSLLLCSCLSAAAAEPGSSARATPVAAAVAAIERGLQSTSYEHRPKIDVKKGIYEWDCSIMAAWILKRAAPRAYAALALDKPLARDFHRTIAAAGTTRPRAGWLRIVGPSEIAPGDVFAWLKPAMFKERKNSGHVGFVIGKPWQHPRFPSVWLMRIADATRELHGDDSRAVGGKGGFGTATIAFAFDDAGSAIAYGWYGEPQDRATFVPTSIVFGRALR